MNSKRDEEINKCILEWFISKNFLKTSEAFMEETSLRKDEATKGNRLDKKWSTIMSLQKKVADLEAQAQQLKEDIESGNNSALNNQLKKDSEFMGLPKSVPKTTIRGHRKEITCLAFHPYLKKLASGSEDATIMIWEMEEFNQEKSIKAHSNTVNYLTFDPTGKFLTSCSADLSIKIWEFDTMTLFKTLNGHDHTVSSVEYMPDGNFLFSASRDKTIKYWEINTGNCLKTLTGHSEWVRSVSVNNKGTLLASSSDDESIIIWQIPAGTELNTLNGHDNKIEKVIFLKNEKAITNIYNSDYVNDFNIQLGLSGDNKSKAEPKKEGKGEIDKEYLLSASRDKTINLWDVVGAVCVKTFYGHDNWVRDLCEHPSGKYFLSSSDDKCVRIWDLKTGQSAKKLTEAHESFVVAVAVSAKCKLVASGSTDMTIKIWDCN